MKLKFDSNQEFQLDAVKAVVDAFEGQHKVVQFKQFSQSDLLGIYPNQLDITPDEIHANIKNIREKNNLNGNEASVEMDFSIEMETGTGKTYVYLRTILELHKKYGFRKFIIIVPSVAIREGVIKTLEITKDHFRELYDNLPYRYYEYVSKNLSQVKNFAQSSNLEIMVMTMGSFNKDANILYLERDQMWGEKAINYIQKTNPIMILDEPQNMEGDVTQERLKNFNALCRLRYSATHRNPYNLLYRLSPADAYRLGLVKKIEVDSVTDSDDDTPTAFVNLLDVASNRTKLKAQVEAFCKQADGQKNKKKVALTDGDDLEEKTNNSDYHGYVVSQMQVHAPDYNKHGFIKFSNGIEIKLGEFIGQNREDLMRKQIQTTIEKHLEKRKELKVKNVKVLSLFFIDKVDSFVKDDGFIRKTFDELFDRLKTGDKELKEIAAKDVRKGYFAQKNGEYLEREQSIADNKEAYDLIMKDKERLLSFDEKTEFIFSHSALKEGWDNPNIFNICTLKTTLSAMRKRQEIGRGMRLCVNQDGERVFDKNVNLLSVIANESYTEYISTLQSEFEEEGIYNTPPSPSNARKRQEIRLRKGFDDEENFREIWARIANKTVYSVAIDSKRLVEEAVKKINALIISKRRITVTTVGIEISNEKVSERILDSKSDSMERQKAVLDCVNSIKEETKLTRSTVIEILKRITPELLFNNPHRLIFEAVKIINSLLSREYVSQITYTLSGDSFSVNQFERIVGYKDKIQPLENKDRSIYDAVVWDSENEKNFAIQLDRDERIKLFIKLPHWFKIETPVGGYIPDWAIVTSSPNQKPEKLYFVIETKTTTDEAGRRVLENEKVECAKKHFEVIKVNYKDVGSYQDFHRLIT